ncbi:hypothetical protein Dimus_034607 [Dionaea muscipula]
MKKSSSSSSTRPMSSPGRADKFPPPLMRFLRINASSRSRSNSRASPHFSRKKTSVDAVQEPSSPKVTCIGQVRARRPTPGGQRRNSASRSRCHCIRGALFWKTVKVELRPRSFRLAWRKWVLFFHPRSVKIRTDSSRNRSNRVDRCEELDGEEDGEEAREERERRCRQFMSPASTPPPPPKNALLLTRCRSAPYRSSSLAGRFWEESPLKTGETKKTEEDGNSGSMENKENKMPTLRNEPCDRDSATKSRMEEVLDVNGGIDERLVKKSETSAVQARNLMLRRCNSEPARGFDPERIPFWDQRRWEFTESSTPHVVD